MGKTLKKNLKSRVFRDNNQYFKFINREGIEVFSVEYTKSHDIRVYYKLNEKKDKNKKSVDKSVICV